MEKRETRKQGFPKYCFSFPKTHSASSLGVISTSKTYADGSPRDDNTKASNDDTDSRNLHSSIINAISLSSSDSDSDTEPNLTPNFLNPTKSHCRKSAFLNVFSSKNRQSSLDNNNTTNNKSERLECIRPSFLSQKGSISLNISTMTLNRIPHSSNSTSVSSDTLLVDNNNIMPTKTTSHSINPVIFKKIVSKKALLPKMKAFKRISDEMQMETCPLHDEMQHELMITTAMKEEEEILNSKASCSSLLLRKNNLQYLPNYDNLKKFEIINKANESWNNNRRKSSSSYTNSEGYASISRCSSLTNLTLLNSKRRDSSSSLTRTNTNNSTTSTIDNNTNSSNVPQKNILKSSLQLKLTNPFTPLRLSRKRKMGNGDEFATDVEECFSDDGGASPWIPSLNNKRRLVSASVTNSPKSPALDPFPSRRNSILIQSIQSTSDDFESISLK